MADGNKVQYQIEVRKTGEGATQAVADFNAVQAAAAKTTSTLVTNTAAVTTATQATKSAANSMRALQGTLTLVGLQSFPQLTLAASTATSAIEGVKAASAAAGVSMMAMGAQLAVITAGAYSAARGVSEFMNMMDAMNKDNDSAAAADASDAKTAAAFKNRIFDLIEQGKLSLSEAEAAELDRLLEHNQFRLARQIMQSKMPVGEFMNESEKAAAVRERLDSLKREWEYDDAVRNTSERNAGSIRTELDRWQEINTVQERSRQLQESYEELRKQGIITEQQWQNLIKETETQRMNSIGELKNALTEVQQLQRASAEMFASGFSGAFVDFVSGTKDAKEAFGDFARSFLNQITQMILQKMILNAIGSTGWGKALGFAEGGMAFSGARFMASGGMQGVSTVSSPTYFPRFNAVAGEAGAEMMTVLARPRLMQVGGMQAVVGSAQGNRLAITDADALAQSGGGINGQAQIVVMLGPGLRGEIVQQSIKGAQVQVAQDMRADTPISRGVKGLAA